MSAGRVKVHADGSVYDGNRSIGLVLRAVRPPYLWHATSTAAGHVELGPFRTRGLAVDAIVQADQGQPVR